ncbi:hypothetical protein ABZ516_32665 [Streptomyces sp. NPDC019826]|uniref:hypothetical protein n=1 Tax=Streptomyces TaxID=1883 RepID=UPI0004BE3A29|nr:MULTISPECIES: hypothetical protein [Streptomyces]MDX3186607.1 hypothetical protein [Streptomyces sp. ME02-7008A-1]MDX3307371.1 hypothetical protein [Streptomyces sp. ME02-7008A]
MQLLKEPDRWPRPFETVLAACRSALDALLQEAGEDFEGPRAAQEQVNTEVAALLKQAGKQGRGPLDKLLAAIDAADVPDVMEQKAGLGAGVQRLIRIPDGRLPVPADPRAEYEAVRELLDLAGRLGALPAAGDDQRTIVEILRRVRQARLASGAAEAAARPDGLAGLRDAWAYYAREVNAGKFRSRQVAHLTNRYHGTAPGLGEEEAFRAWSKFYRRTSGSLHGGGAEDETSTRRLVSDFLAHVEQLLLDLPALAPLLVSLARNKEPSAADGAAVAAIHQPRAIRWFFANAVSPAWLDLVNTNRLLPEAGRWPAQPYLERVAQAYPQRVLEWLGEHRAAFTSVDPAVLAGLLRVAGTIGGASAPEVRTVVRQDGTVETLWRQLVVWLVDVPADERDVDWVEVAKRVLLYVVDHPAGQYWEFQAQLTDLQRAAYGPDGARETAVVRAVRGAMNAVVDAAVNSEAEQAGLDMADDLRQAVSADGFGPSATRIAVRARLDFARTEFQHGVTLAQRTAGWPDLPGPSRWADRVLAAHLLETVPQQYGDSEISQSWLTAARGLLTRLGDVKMVGADTVDLLAAALDRCPPDALPAMEAELVQGLGAAPTGADLDAGRRALADWNVPAPRGWDMVWSLSPVLPAPVLAPWQPAVDAVTDLIGPAPAKLLPRFQIVPYLDTLTAAAQDLAPVATSQGAPAAAALLLDRQRTGSLSLDYARIVLGRLVATDPALWATDVPAVAAALADPALQQAYLAALRTPLTADPCPLPDHEPTTRAVIAALWDLLSAPGIGASVQLQAQLTLCLALSEAWTHRIDLGDIAVTFTAWLETAVTAWTEPTTSEADPLSTAHQEIGGLALDALIRHGLTFVYAPAELTVAVETLLDGIIDAGTDDRALAVIGHHLPALIQHAPRWVDRHKAALFDLDNSVSPAVLGINSQRSIRPEGLRILQRLDPVQLAIYLSRTSGDSTKNATLWQYCAALLLAKPATLGGRPEFLALLAARDGGPAAISRLLGDAEHLLPRTATPENAADIEQGVDLWRSVLALDVPGSAGHLRSAGNFAHAAALDDAVWLELTAQTIERTTDITNITAVARRAARRPDLESAHQVLAVLVAAKDPDDSTLASFRTAEIKNAGITLWQTSQPGTPGRRDLGQTLALHHDFLEGAVAE